MSVSDYIFPFLFDPRGPQPFGTTVCIFNITFGVFLSKTRAGFSHGAGETVEVLGRYPSLPKIGKSKIF